MPNETMSFVFFGFKASDYPSLWPNIYSMRLRKLMWKPDESRGRVFYVLDALGSLFLISQFVELWIVRNDMDKVTDNLALTLLVMVVHGKLLTVYCNDNHLRLHKIVESISQLELIQLSGAAPDEENKAVRKYIYRCRLMSYSFWTICVLTLTLSYLKPVLELLNGNNYATVYSAWLPDVMSSGRGYVIGVIWHLWSGLWAALVVWVFDPIVACLMITLAGQVDVLKTRFEKIFDDPNRCFEAIARCRRHHLFILKCSRELNSLISPIMYVYFLVCSVMLCACLARINSDSASTLHKIWGLEYAGACLFELLLLFWFSNDLTIAFARLEEGLWRAKWWQLRPSPKIVRREMILLSRAVRTEVHMTAGPFTKMNTQNFIAVLKGAYSYYTLLHSAK